MFDQGPLSGAIPQPIFLYVSQNSQCKWGHLSKATIDFLLASLGIIFAAPIFLIVAFLVSLDGGPVFYAHSRLGRNGCRFMCLKFRSMATNGDAVLLEHLIRDKQAAQEWAATRKLTIDPRITKIGRLLRITSLDELPQLINVLRFEMSLVGPRPIVEQEVIMYGKDISLYFQTRPGLTGLWQISGRSDTSYAERVRLDSWYVNNWSLWLDLVILAKTLPAVFFGRGAR